MNTSTYNRARQAAHLAGTVTVIGGSLVVAGQPAGAASFTVDNTNDNGAGSLRQAIDDANAAPGADTITFDPSVAGTIMLTSGPLGINDDLTIVGPGESVVTLSTLNSDILYVYNAADLTLSDITITGADQDGIVTSASGDLTLTSVTVSRSAQDGVVFDGPGSALKITDSSIVDNFDDGVYVAAAGSVTVLSSSLSGNRDSGLYEYNAGVSGSVVITDSTLDGNSEAGVHFDDVGGDFTVTNSSISGNNDDGFHLYEVAGTVSIVGSTVNDNDSDGLYLVYAAALAITGSSFNGNGANGVEVEQAIDGGVTIEDSHFDNNENDGLYIDGEVLGDASISDSTFIDNAYNGFDIDDVGGLVSVTRTTVAGNGETGIELGYAGGGFTVTDSTVSTNDDRGVNVSSGLKGNTLITGSTIDDNGEAGIDLTAAVIDGDVTIVDTLVRLSGGAAVDLRNVDGAVTINRSTLDGFAESGVRSRDDALSTVSILNSTITGGFSETPVIDIADASSVAVQHSTVTDNTVDLYALIATNSSAVTVDHSIVTGNTTLGFSTVVGAGSVTVTDSLTPVGSGLGASNTEADDPELYALADIGGDTPTMLPMIGSPALDAGTATPAFDDQRGLDRVVGAAIDLGSVERQGLPSLSIADATVDENAGTVTLEVERSSTGDGPVSFDFATADGSATAPDDFTQTSASGAFAIDEGGVISIEVPITDDTIAEPDETFAANLSNPTNATLADDSATVTILDVPPPLAALSPARFVDTRSGQTTVDGEYNGDGKLSAGGEYTVQIAGRGDVPADATAVTMNITAIGSTSTGYVTAHPCLTTPPLASSLNYTAGVNLGNEVTVPLNASGEACFYTSASIHLTVDVVGFVPAGSRGMPVNPARLLDTRIGAETIDAIAAGRGQVPAGATEQLQVGGRGGVPDDAAAVIINVTSIRPSETGFVTVHPCLPSAPVTSSLNVVAGTTRGNELIAELDANGQLCLVPSVAMDLVVDVTGYVPAGTALNSVTPGRLLDTRDNGTTIDGLQIGGGKPAAGSQTTLAIGGRGGVPADARAAIVNVTAVGPEAVGFVTVHPCVDPRPTAAALNYVPGVNGGNEIIASLDADGEICLYTSAATHLTVDVVGYLS